MSLQVRSGYNGLQDLSALNGLLKEVLGTSGDLGTRIVGTWKPFQSKQFLLQLDLPCAL